MVAKQSNQEAAQRFGLENTQNTIKTIPTSY